MLERPRLAHSHARLLSKMVSLRPLLTPAVKETRLGSALFEAIQTTMRNTSAPWRCWPTPTGAIARATF